MRRDVIDAAEVERIERAKELDRELGRLERLGRWALFLQGFGLGMVLTAAAWKLLN